MKRVEPRSDWSAETRHVYEHDQVEWWDGRRMPHYHRSCHAAVEMLLGVVCSLRPRRVLDVGCAQATLDLLLAERGIAMTCVDIRRGFLDYARLRHERGTVRWVHGDFLELDVAGAPFDLVMSHHVIEHVTRPDAFVARLARSTRPGGHVLITTPNAHYFRNRLPSYSEAGDLGHYPGFANSCDGGDHVFAFTRAELCGLGVAAGLRVARHFFYESFLLAGHLKLRHLHRVLPACLTRVAEPLARVPGLRSGLFNHQGVLLRKPDASCKTDRPGATRQCGDPSSC